MWIYSHPIRSSPSKDCTSTWNCSLTWAAIRHQLPDEWLVQRALADDTYRRRRQERGFIHSSRVQRRVLGLFPLFPLKENTSKCRSLTFQETHAGVLERSWLIVTRNVE